MDLVRNKLPSDWYTHTALATLAISKVYYFTGLTDFNVSSSSVSQHVTPDMWNAFSRFHSVSVTIASVQENGC